MVLSSEKESLTELMRGQEQVIEGLRSMSQIEVDGMIAAIQSQSNALESTATEQTQSVPVPSSRSLGESVDYKSFRSAAVPSLSSDGCGNARDIPYLTLMAFSGNQLLSHPFPIRFRGGEKRNKKESDDTASRFPIV